MVCLPWWWCVQNSNAAASLPPPPSPHRPPPLVTGMIKLALPAGKANPAPPVGPALGAKGVNIMQFCKEYNAATQDKAGTIIPVEITVYEVWLMRRD